MKNLLLALAVTGLLMVPAAAQRPYGTGTAGASGLIPTLSAPQAFMGNLGFGYTIAGGLGGAQAFLLTSLSAGQQVFGGTTILVSLNPAAFLGSTPIQLGGPGGVPGAGSAFFGAPIAIPVIPSLAGFKFFAQAVVLDFASPNTIAATRGLESELTFPPQAFLGTSVGFPDPHYFVDPISLAVTTQTGTLNNVNSAQYVRGGSEMFVGTGFSALLHGDTSVTPAVFTTIYSSAGLSCAGAYYDRATKLVYTLTDPTGANQREIVALDGDGTSPTFGQVVAQSSLGIVFGADRWALSPSGKRAVVNLLNQIIIVDTDVTSPTYLQALDQPTIQDVSFGLPVKVEITPDDSQALVLLYEFMGSSRVARYDLETFQWIDHHPTLAGIQNIGPNSLPPALLGPGAHGFDLSQDGSFAFISGSGNFAGRLDIIDTTSSGFTYTPFTPGPMDDFRSDELAINPDGTLVAMAVAGNTSAMPPRPPQIQFVDPVTGLVVSRATLTASGQLNLGGMAFR